MSRKTPTEPPQRHRTLVQELLVPGLVLGGAIVVALLVLMFGDRLAGGDTTPAQTGNTISEAQLQTFQNKYDELGVTLGAEDAPVTIREFADYQCPACGAFADTAHRIREEYVDEGKVRFIFFDLPLRSHRHAHTAAAAARCAGRQDAYWTYHDKLFATQERWSAESNPAEGTFLDLAVESGIRLEPFQRCLEQGATDQIIDQNVDIARDLRVSSTPTVLVNRQVFAGVASYDKIKNAIEARLPTESSQ